MGIGRPEERSAMDPPPKLRQVPLAAAEDVSRWFR
jgi:hypothetical protein